jgi:hypothetical protein
MGFFTTHWAGTYEGHTIKVVRAMGGHHFELLIDDKAVDSTSSWVNVGNRHLEGKLEHGGRELLVKALGVQGAFTESATVSVDGHDVPMTKVK